jgi:Rps23 Pro-64 3,4-dihydroxylase Tpa1-like proline 4-hydroxylase
MSERRPSPQYSRTEIADLIVERLDGAEVARAANTFRSSGIIQNFAIDSLLPDAVARTIMDAFPQPQILFQRKSLRESKYVTSQMNRYEKQVEEAVFAFHDQRVVDKINEITSLAGLQPDRQLYAGGISMMKKGDFLNPHLDNSHDYDREFYRVLNLLYYCTSDWRSENGGNLEIWPDGVKKAPVVIPSAFNRLVVMTTGADSWHSVSPIKADVTRRCVSNYYFSKEPLGGQTYSRVTSFRGRPEQPIRDLVLQIDALGRQWIRKLRPSGVVTTRHRYIEANSASDV